jgi:hypothetical protein
MVAFAALRVLSMGFCIKVSVVLVGEFDIGLSDRRYGTRESCVEERGPVRTG